MKSGETYFVLNGEGLIHVDDEVEKIQKNQSVFIPAFSMQYIENTGEDDLEVLCIVDPAWKKDDEISV